MKHILILFGFLLFITPTLTNANSDNEPLRMTLQPSVISLDPAGVQDSQSWIVSRQVNCQLVRSQGSVFVLDAAESIRYITPLKIILKISNKARFHDGSPVTSDDVLASFNYIKKSRTILNNLFTWIDKIDIIDNKTISFALKRPIPQFLKVLSSTNYTIFNKDFLDKAKTDKSLWKNPLGCGGYKVADFNNNYIKLTPVSQGLPITFFLSKTSQIDASELEKYDIVGINVIGTSKELDNFNELEMFDPIQFYVGLNSNSKKWKSKYERCKFLSELDINGLLASYGNTMKEANDLLPKGVLGYNINENFNDQMTMLSRKSINGKLDAKPQPFCLSYLTVSIQEKYKNEYLKMFKKHYPTVIMKPISDVKKFGKDFLNDNCDAILFAWKSNYLDGYEYLTVFQKNEGNFSGIYNKTISNQILHSQDILSAEGRATEYQKIVKEIGDFCIIRPLFTSPQKRIYVRKTLRTPGIGLISIHQYYLGNITRQPM
ncbi:MAG: ABC transporter substrate-binding protein [Gammaproteobacteria bacterium]